MKKRVGAAMRSGVLLALMAALLWQNEAVGQAVRQGLALCARSVIPALFPFFAAVSFAVDCGFFDMLRQLDSPGGPPYSCWAPWAAIRWERGRWASCTAAAVSPGRARCAC